MEALRQPVDMHSSQPLLILYNVASVACQHHTEPDAPTCCCQCRADSAAKGDDRTAKLPEVVSAANDVIAAINATELAAFLAMRAPADTDGDSSSGSNGSIGSDSGGSNGSSAAEVYKETKAEKEKEKSALLEALKTKLKAQLDLAEVGRHHPLWLHLILCVKLCCQQRAIL